MFTGCYLASSPLPGAGGGGGGSEGGGGGGTPVTFDTGTPPTANGSATATTTEITFTLSEAIAGLTADDITLSGVAGVTKGTLSGAGPTYTLGISGFTAGGELTITITKTGYTISGSQTVTIYYYSGSGGGLPVEMVYVPGGSFQMGGDGQSSGGDGTDSIPVRTVTLTQGFYMGKYEVTQAQWQAVMGTTIEQQQALAPVSIQTTTNYGRGAVYPIYYVSWYDALVFCNKLSVMEGLTPAYSISGSTDPTAWGTVPTSSNTTWNAVTVVSGSTGYRLPTEAQWEYAAKGGSSAGYKVYSGSDTIDDVAWYDGNNGSIGETNYGTKQVGTKTANSLGLYDMSGNVFEWCWDRYGTYPAEAETDPMGASSGSGRVQRGGCWDYPAQYARSAYREIGVPNSRFDDRGVRVLRPAP